MNARDYGNGCVFTISEEEIPHSCFISIRPNITINNLVFKPMLRKCDENGNPIGDDTYEPYKETVTTIPTLNGLAGIPVDSDGNYTDECGQQWICDEIVKFADGSGERVQRFKHVLVDGVNNSFVSKSSSNKNTIYMIRANDVKKATSDNIIAKLMCTRFSVVNASDGYSKNLIGTYVNKDYNYVYFAFGLDSELTTLELANAWLVENPFDVYYELETPIRTPLTAEEVAEIEKLHTFYPVTNISNNGDCGMEVTYLADSKNYIDKRLAQIEQALVNNI